MGWFVLLSLVALSALGGDVLAGRSLFDADYRDCPSRTRLRALSNVRVARTEEADELRVTWDTTRPASWHLGNNVYTALITIILESEDKTKTLTSEKAPGSTSATFKDLAPSTDWVVQVAVTDRGYVISDIVEDAITSSVPAPWFDIPIWYGMPSPLNIANLLSHLDTARVGRFYYLGFNREFANWYVTHDDGSEGKADVTPKFRVGLRHNMLAVEVDAVEFDHFRVRVVDGGGDDVLGFDAATVGNGDGSGNFRSSPVYQNDSDNLNRPLVWDVRGMPTAAFGSGGMYAPGKGNTIHFANHARSNKLDKGEAPAIRSLFTPATAHALAPITRASGAVAANAGAILEQTKTSMSFQTLKVRWPFGAPTGNSFTLGSSLHTLGPEGMYDLPADIFMDDDNYTVTGWMENGDDEQISPRTSVTFSARTIAYIPKTARLYRSTNGGAAGPGRTIGATTMCGAMSWASPSWTAPTTTIAWSSSISPIESGVGVVWPATRGRCEVADARLGIAGPRARKRLGREPPRGGTEPSWEGSSA